MGDARGLRGDWKGWNSAKCASAGIAGGGGGAAEAADPDTNEEERICHMSNSLSHLTLCCVKKISPSPGWMKCPAREEEGEGRNL
jgi:hypothetical protein